MATENTIELAQKYLPLLDEIYKTSSLTAILDQTEVQIMDGNAIKVYKTAMQGLGNYERSKGYADGSVTGTWETLMLMQDRGRSFVIDRMDNEESLNMAFGKLASEFIRTKVVPEADAYRFAKYAGTSGILTTAGAALTSSDAVLAAIDTAVAEMHNHEIPTTERVLFVSPAIYGLLKRSSAAVRFATMQDTAISTNFEVFDGLRVIMVPQSRFYTGDGQVLGVGVYPAMGIGLRPQVRRLYAIASLQVQYPVHG